ncbi:MAG: hypothetical protein ACLQUZ_06180, partial [Rhizomicrobium sp.]
FFFEAITRWSSELRVVISISAVPLSPALCCRVPIPLYADDIALTDPITNDAQGMRMSLEIILKNVGHFPAQYTSVDFKIFVTPANIREAANKVCKDTEIGDVNFWNAVTLFPEKPTPYGIGETFKKSEILKAKSYFRGEKRPVTEPIIIGCITYKLTSNGEYHHTPFIRMLEMTNPADASGCCTVPFDRPFIPANAITLKSIPLDQIGPAT